MRVGPTSQEATKAINEEREVFSALTSQRTPSSFAHFAGSIGFASKVTARPNLDRIVP